MTRYDKLIIVSVAAFSILMWTTFQLWPSPDRLVAVVEIAGQKVLEFEVPQLGSQEVFQYQVAFPRGEATIETQNGKVRILPMPSEVCPLGICSATGWIGRTGQSIVCLPNRIVITLRGRGPGVDGVTF
ncbi:MAG: NusG domain II-containing protein [Bacillota bacterium]